MVQADVVLVSGRYVRDVARGAAKRIIPDPADAEDDDLVRHRLERGLPPRPAVAVITTTGDFDPIAAAGLSDKVVVVHGAQVDANTSRSWADAGLASAFVGTDGRVDVALLMESLTALGYQLVFSAAGPKILAMLLPALDALYVTVGSQLLGGRSFMTLLDGDVLAPSKGFTIRSVYLDKHAPAGTDQLFIEFEAIARQ
jgi:riboflavin biosynthesis pyrimidine reductase